MGINPRESTVMTVKPRYVMLFVVCFVAAALVTHWIETEQTSEVPEVDLAVEQVNATIEQTDVPVEQQTIEQRLDWLFGNVQPFRQFFTDFRVAVSNNNPQIVATFIAFPLHEGDTLLAYNRPQFIERYGKIFTPKVRDAVLTQAWTGLFAKCDGIMFGNGEVWASASCPIHPDGDCDSRSQIGAFAFESTTTEEAFVARIKSGQSGHACSSMRVRVIAINRNTPDPQPFPGAMSEAATSN